MYEDSLYVVMRYVAGGDLEAMLNAAGRLDLERTLSLLMPIALALDAAHAHGLVHRDVKPANILIERSAAGDVEHVYLSDFGIAKSASLIGRSAATAGLMDAVEYVAPEQLEDRELSAQTDIYALAATFYQCLAGRVPYPREPAQGVGATTAAPEPVSGQRADVPPALDGVIAKALSPNPLDRGGTCGQFLRACGYVFASRSPAAGEPPESDRATVRARCASGHPAAHSGGAGPVVAPPARGRRSCRPVAGTARPCRLQLRPSVRPCRRRLCRPWKLSRAERGRASSRQPWSPDQPSR